MYTVVVADNEWEARRSFVEHISWVECGFRVVGEASNGMEALELVEKEKPDLLLTDIHMPFLSGIELAQMARDIHPTIRVAFLSGCEEFRYAQQAIKYNVISYMLKPLAPQELVKELNLIREKMDVQARERAEVSARPLQKSEFLVPLLLGASLEPMRNRVESDLWSQAMECGIITAKQKGHSYVVLATDVTTDDKRSAKTHAHMGAVDDIFKKHFSSVSSYIGGRVLTLAFFKAGDMEEQLNVPLREIVQILQSALGIGCHIGVSGEKEQLLECHIAYMEAMGALDTTFADTGSIRYASDFAPHHAVRAELFDQVMEIQNVLGSGDKETMEQFIDELFLGIREGQYALPEIHMILAQCLSSMIHHIAVSADTETAKRIWSAYPLIHQSFALHSVDYIHSAIREFCGMIIEALEQQNYKNAEQLSQSVLEIIRLEYGNENLTLSDIGERLHISGNYLSQLVRKETGESFVKLLTAKRLDSAKLLLESTSLKIVEIAQKCGYSDPYYFSHCFKKRFGQTPISLRRASSLGMTQVDTRVI